MAALTFVATDIDGNRHDIPDVTAYKISMDRDAACHGLRLDFAVDGVLAEYSKIRVYNNGKCMFNGYVDTQRECSDESGTTCFIYARSSACLLTDNDATPCVYVAPSAAALCRANAADLGFTWDLPDIYTTHPYQVGKGVSCFGAINDFVRGITGDRITVGADDCISVPQGSYRGSVDPSGVISERRIIDRGDVVTRLDYKAGKSGGYDHHIRSAFLEKRGIRTSKKESLSSLPEWQRDSDLIHILYKGARDYHRYDIVLAGAVDYAIGDTVDLHSAYFGDLCGLVVRSICYVMDKNGESTRLTLAQNFDLEEMTYVD